MASTHRYSASWDSRSRHGAVIAEPVPKGPGPHHLGPQAVTSEDRTRQSAPCADSFPPTKPELKDLPRATKSSRPAHPAPTVQRYRQYVAPVRKQLPSLSTSLNMDNGGKGPTMAQKEFPSTSRLLEARKCPGELELDQGRSNGSRSRLQPIPSPIQGPRDSFHLLAY